MPAILLWEETIRLSLNWLEKDGVLMKKSVWIPIAALCVLVLVLLASPLILFLHILDGMTENTVVMTLDSPQGTYTAKVIDSDQDAMGGNTFVDIYKKSWFSGEKKVARVYSGPWGQYQTMDIYWKDEHCLVINGVEYPIDWGLGGYTK